MVMVATDGHRLAKIERPNKKLSGIGGDLIVPPKVLDLLVKYAEGLREQREISKLGTLHWPTPEDICRHMRPDSWDLMHEQGPQQMARVREELARAEAYLTAIRRLTQAQI